MDNWKKQCVKKGKWDYYPIDPRAFRQRYALRGATVHETMGPHWKPIIWIANRPHVLK